MTCYPILLSSLSLLMLFTSVFYHCYHYWCKAILTMLICLFIYYYGCSIVYFLINKYHVVYLWDHVVLSYITDAGLYSNIAEGIELSDWMGRAIVFPLVDKFSVALVRELFALWSILVDGSLFAIRFLLSCSSHCHFVSLAISPCQSYLPVVERSLITV